MSYDVIVIGSGVSGLHSAKLLQNNNLKVLVVEAADYVGGRLKQLDGFANWPIELGGELIHGKGTYLDKYVDENKWDKLQVFNAFSKYINDHSPTSNVSEFFYLGREGKLLPYNTNDKDVIHLKQVLSKASEQNISPNVNLLQFLVNEGVSYRVFGIADALTAKVYGTDLERLGVNEIKEEEDQCGDHEGSEINMKLKGSYKLLVENLKEGLNIKLKWPVKEINYTGDLVEVKNHEGQILMAKKVIISVPITILRDNDITFNPPLPVQKQKAIQSIGMDEGACKLFLKFSMKFWEGNIGILICADCFIPEIWIDGGPSRESDQWVFVGFATGDSGRYIGSVGEEEAIRLFLNQLDKIFGSPYKPTPASDHFIEGILFDWTKMPYVRGSYSYPKLNSVGCRKELKKPVMNKLFFCGEATSDCESGTVNGSMLSGKRAAEEVMSSAQSKL